MGFCSDNVCSPRFKMSVGTVDAVGIIVVGSIGTSKKDAAIFFLIRLHGSRCFFALADLKTIEIFF